MRIVWALVLYITYCLSGCASHTPLESLPPIAVTTTQTKGAPTWIDNEESMPGVITAVGISQPNPLGDKAMQRTEALGDARLKLAQKISVKVQGVFNQLDQHLKSGGSLDSSGKPMKTDVMSRMVENTTSQIVNVELSGASARQFYTDPVNGDLYVQLVLTKETLDKMLTSSASNMMRKEIANGSTDLQSALGRLNEAIEKSK